MKLGNLGSAESFTITATRLPGSKFSVRSGTSQIETVILADQVLEPMIFDRHVLAFDGAVFAEASAEFGHIVRFGICCPGVDNRDTDIPGCCARATSGHANAVPPKAAINFRLAILIAVGTF